MHNMTGVTGDARKRIEAEDAARETMPFDHHPQCAYCQRRYEHTHVVRQTIRMAEYPGTDPT